MTKSRRKRAPKTPLKLPDLEQSAFTANWVSNAVCGRLVKALNKTHSSIGRRASRWRWQEHVKAFDDRLQKAEMARATIVKRG